MLNIEPSKIFLDVRLYTKLLDNEKIKTEVTEEVANQVKVTLQGKWI